jgi:hypothetical protein
MGAPIEPVIEAGKMEATNRAPKKGGRPGGGTPDRPVALIRLIRRGLASMMPDCRHACTRAVFMSTTPTNRVGA